MVNQTTLARIQSELQILSEALGEDAIPQWGLVPGDTSVFIHPSTPIPCPTCQLPVPLDRARIVRTSRCSSCGTILFSEGHLTELEIRSDEVDLAGLVAHEYYHFLQMRRGLNQDRPHIREVNARRFARQWVQRRFPGRIGEFNDQPIRPEDRGVPPEPGIVIDYQSRRELMSPSLEDRFADATPEEAIFLDESWKPRGRPISTPLWLRFKLQRDGPTYPYNIWKQFRAFLEKFGYKYPRYEAIRNLMWMLHHELGFLRVIGEDDSEFGDDRRIYEVVPDFDRDERWRDPTGVLYGRKR